jgi:hypothetical protein
MPTRKLPKDIVLLRQSFRYLLLHHIGKCEHPDCPHPDYRVGLAVHEALVPVAFLMHNKRDVDNEVLKHLLFHPSNPLLLHNYPCHQNKCPSREQTVEILARRRDSFYSEFRLRSFSYAIQHFYHCFTIFRDKG